MWVDDAHVITTDHDHRSSTTVQNCDLLRTNKQLSRSHKQILISLGDKSPADICECKVDLGLTDNSTCNVANEHELSHVRQIKYSRPSGNFGRSRSETKGSIYAKRDREPSRIPITKIVHLMAKNKSRRRKIKMFIKTLIPKSSAWHNLLSTLYRKNGLSETNE